MKKTFIFTIYLTLIFFGTSLNAFANVPTTQNTSETFFFGDSIHLKINSVTLDKEKVILNCLFTNNEDYSAYISRKDLFLSDENSNNYPLRKIFFKNVDIPSNSTKKVKLVFKISTLDFSTLVLKGSIKLRSSFNHPKESFSINLSNLF